MSVKPLLEFNDKGIFCSAGNFYIDPWQPVKYAVITHAHSDHAKWGHEHYLAHTLSREVLKYRLGEINLETMNYGKKTIINGVQVSFHPAGHIIGSSQIRVEYKGEVWVASGDYKLQEDGLSTPFEPVACDVFITESTFGLPCFQWAPSQVVFNEMNQWWMNNRSQGITSILLGYALGKSQRILKGLNASIGPIFAHGSVWNLTELIRSFYPSLPPLEKVTAETSK